MGIGRRALVVWASTCILDDLVLLDLDATKEITRERYTKIGLENILKWYTNQ